MEVIRLSLYLGNECFSYLVVTYMHVYKLLHFFVKIIGTRTYMEMQFDLLI